jgi:hypothetical protein
VGCKGSGTHLFDGQVRFSVMLEDLPDDSLSSIHNGFGRQQSNAAHKRVEGNEFIERLEAAG